ncbi:MAG: hypothetical protein Q8Q52_03780 [Acidimicrobiia bacterium]|nr:hypothetical protein [Acidimicrobiia bacterium]
MFFKQFYLDSLGHASYLVGSEETGDALVLDPRRDVGIYLEAARTQELRIAYVIDTHGHNDRNSHPFARRLHKSAGQRRL